MRYLVDGYNLLYSLGRLTPRTPRHGLEGARQSLIIRLASNHGEEAAQVTVVFDSRSAQAGCARETRQNGIRVVFSHGQTADDLIEDLIRAEAVPAQLTVVSDDRRLRQAAQRRGCGWLGNLDYLEGLKRPAATPVPAPEAAKPESISRAEVERWLDVFKDAEDEGDWRAGY